MKSYIVPLDIEVPAADRLDAIERARWTIGNAIDTLDDAKRREDALVLQTAEYGELYLLGQDDTGCIYDHDHAQGGCQVHD